MELQTDWNNLLLPQKDELWEIYHLNSKLTDFDFSTNDNPEKQPFDSPIFASKIVESIAPSNDIKTSPVYEQLLDLCNSSWIFLDDNSAHLSVLIHHPKTGLYHYVRPENKLKRLNSDIISDALSTKNISILVLSFISALIKYQGERGYRNAILDSGRLVQNITNSAHQRGITVEIVHEFNDFEIEDHIGIDGMHHSLVSVLNLSI